MNIETTVISPVFVIYFLKVSMSSEKFLLRQN